MTVSERIEIALQSATAALDSDRCPPSLAEAIRHAVFAGGSRTRPRLTIGVAGACGAPNLGCVDRAAAAIELLHCAALTHDDLPCFDDAPTRRGRPSVHSAFGEQLAVLTGDALIVMAFEQLGQVTQTRPVEGAALTALVAASVGPVGGIAAGQAWESETSVDLQEYHHAKTSVLFEAAVMAGAIAASVDPTPWRMVGTLLGNAYQVADDLADVLGDSRQLGKPTGNDARLGRPSAATELGVQRAMKQLHDVLADSLGAVPPCPGQSDLHRQLEQLGWRLSRRLRPMSLKRSGDGGKEDQLLELKQAP